MSIECHEVDAENVEIKIGAKVGNAPATEALETSNFRSGKSAEAETTLTVEIPDTQVLSIAASSRILPKALKWLVGDAGIEPATSRLGDSRQAACELAHPLTIFT